ncbi:sulfatase-like hydrolase/transferase [Bythopirellula polymerisocia]|uniref:sulfatase-like hydrolase/transferase n=1 Tax=Bythopirellula polymerisocia TaxID=2528003 RepID=UPI0018D35C0C|nr:sulfatase-like hydrolase/transferase [Bythopirellula polymerisocia]
MNLLSKSLSMSLAAAAYVAVAVQPVVAQSNVVVIISDDDGWADYGFMRNADPAADPGNRGAVPTPNLDILATMGVAFTNAYTGSVCSPSRAMITTGQYGMRFGYGSNILDGNGAINTTNTPQGLPTEAVTIWERMQGVGYETAAVGKWHIGAHSSGGGSLGNRPEDQGVEFFQGLWGGSRDYFLGSQTGNGQLRETISDGVGGVSSNTVIEGNYSGQYVTDVFGDQSADYIKNKAGGAAPFFLYSSFTAPHTPMQATASDLAYIDSLGEPGFTGNRRTFAAMQYAMDRNVGKILDALKDPAGDGTGPGNDSDSILDDTLIIFINDNGGDCCDVGPNSSDNGDLRNGKGSQFEGGMRVPMIIAGAGVNLAQHGTVSTNLVHSIDIVPTALVGAGGGSFSPGEIIDGKNLLPYINGTESGLAHENLFIPRFNNQQSAVRMGQWKYMYQNGTGYQLYNLATDIKESNNVVNSPANAAVVDEMHQLLASYHVQMDKPRHDNQADETNQFDHFRFREGNFATATFSTANAWTNGDTGSGTFTASWRDGYANNELTFRTKATGDYSVTNDLNSVGGLGYMANKINLTTGSAALTTNRTATINGQPLMLTNNLNGAGPEINLDATDAQAKTFTFNIDHDVEIYDDLKLQGDGNQNFAINGKIREFRPGRNVSKIGTSDLTLGGGVDISGSLDVQGGKVAFTNGQFRGNLMSQPGSSLIIGGVGFNEISTGPPSSAPIVTTGLNLNFDAMQSISGTSTWVDAESGQSLSFGGTASTSPVSDVNFPGITAAYHIPATGGAGGLNNYFEGSSPLSRKDATFEVWFNVTTPSGGGDQVLFEAGGSDLGVSFLLDDNDLSFNVNGVGTGSTTFSLNQSVGTGWHQAVGVIDLKGAVDSITLYVDNSLVGSLNGLSIDDWAGGNNTGIGAAASSLGAGGTPIPYHDKIAVVRYYENVTFGANEVNQNYQWAKFDPGMGTTGPTLLAIDGDYTQHDGASLDLELLATSMHDAVSVTGSATIDGILNVGEISGFAPAAGDSFTILSATNGVSGQFDTINLPALSGMQWFVDYLANEVTLSIILGADFDGSGVVDGQDFLRWQRGFGLNGQSDNSNGDADGNGVVDGNDLKIWQAQYGTSPGILTSSLSSVPEPSSGFAAIWGSLLMTWFQARGASSTR